MQDAGTRRIICLGERRNGDPGTGPRERSYHLASNRGAVGAEVTRDCWVNLKQDRYQRKRNCRRSVEFRALHLEALSSI
jgi:hypothetical protein